MKEDKLPYAREEERDRKRSGKCIDYTALTIYGLVVPEQKCNLTAPSNESGDRGHGRLKTIVG